MRRQTITDAQRIQGRDVPRPGSAESGKVLSYSDSLGAMVWASPGTGSGGVSAVDKSSFVEGTDSFTPIGGVYNETPAGDPTEDQTAVVRITGKRALHLNLRTAAGVEIGTSGSPVRTDTTGTTSQPVSAASLRAHDRGEPPRGPPHRRGSLLQEHDPGRYPAGLGSLPAAAFGSSTGACHRR
jgi:hypothetical protein